MIPVLESALHVMGWRLLLDRTVVRMYTKGTSKFVLSTRRRINVRTFLSVSSNPLSYGEGQVRAVSLYAMLSLLFLCFSEPAFNRRSSGPSMAEMNRRARRWISHSSRLGSVSGVPPAQSQALPNGLLSGASVVHASNKAYPEFAIAQVRGRINTDWPSEPALHYNGVVDISSSS